MSKDSASQRNSEFTRKFDTPRSKKTTITNHGKAKSKVGSAQGNNRKSFLSNAPQIRIIQNIEEVQNNSSFIHPDHMLDVTSLNDDERSRLSVSSHEVSGQQMISISRRVSEDWEDDEKRKMKKLREFFIKLYEKVLSKKGGVTDSRTSLEGGSDEEGGTEDWGLDIYELVSKQMANQELCDAAGVKVIDESNLLGRSNKSLDVL